MKERVLPRFDPNSINGVSNFVGRVKGIHVIVVNFVFETEFMVVEDISSIVDPSLTHVILGEPFIEKSRMTYNTTEGVVRMTHENGEIAYKMPQMIPEYSSYTDLDKEMCRSVYLRDKEDLEKGTEYVMSQILGFYKEKESLGPKYRTKADFEMDEKKESEPTE